MKSPKDYETSVKPKYTFSNRVIAGNYCTACPCTISLSKPLHVGTAIDSYLTPLHEFTAPARLSLNKKFVIPEQKLKFGEDFLFGVSRSFPKATNGWFKEEWVKDGSMGDTERELKKHMRELRREVSNADRSHMSNALMEAFFSKKAKPEIWEDSRWNDALDSHPNIIFFMEAALSAPGMQQRSGGKMGIHQKLVAVGMDISAINRADDLGVSAVNLGNDWAKRGVNTADFANGMAFMANGLQYIYVYATDYCYSQINRIYDITLEYHFYDVFGLDDDDLVEYGQERSMWQDGQYAPTENVIAEWDYAQGITAWWQLQFHHGYAPLVTRGVTQRTFTVLL